jgi:hypothetical protein
MRDPYDAVRELAKELEAEGLEPGLIVDALLTVGLGAGARLGGPETVIDYLHRMIAHYEAGPQWRASSATRQ